MQKAEKKIEEFYIHFDQDKHYLSVKDYELVIKTTKEIFNNVTKDIMEINDVELLVYAPEKGCIITIFGISIGVGGILYFLETDIGKTFVKGLLGHEPSYWAGKTGELIRAIIIKLYTASQDELKTFIEEMRKINEVVVKLDKSLKAISNFYIMCNKNAGLRGIGFEKEENFPIQRKDFFSHFTDDIIRDLGVHNEYKALTIVKPVTKRTSKGKWTLSETGTNEEQNYSMEDEAFREKTLNGDFVKQNPEDDEIIALTEYNLESKNGNKVIKDRKVVTVYEFNKNKFENRELPSDFELNNAKLKADLTGQLNLFEQNIEGDKDA